MVKIDLLNRRPKHSKHLKSGGKQRFVSSERRELCLGKLFVPLILELRQGRFY